MSEEENIRKFKFRKITRDEITEETEIVAVEEPYELIINGSSLTSIWATPTDIRELGIGYLVSEGIVDSKEQINSVEVEGDKIKTEVVSEGEIERNLELRSSGNMGVLGEKIKDEITLDSQFKISPDLVFEVLSNLDTEMYRRTSGSHSATLIDGEGEILAKAADVSRHNSYDKVIGKALLDGAETTRSVLLSSGRQSAGMVKKAVRVGIPITISKAAPLSSGIEAAEAANMTLICFANPEKFNLFTGRERIQSYSKADSTSSG